jgi:SAM-dependent methyltransferase
MAVAGDLWDPVAYAAWFDTPLGRQVWADEERALLAVLDPAAGDQVLDAACGDGRLLAALAARGTRAIGVDAGAAMLAAARTRLRAAGVPVSLVRADLATLPFAAGAFDAVTAVTVLCVAAAPEATLRELARAVRQGGRVVVGELGRWSLWALRRRLRGRRRGAWHGARFWTARQLGHALRAAGLAPRVTRSAVFYPPISPAARLLHRLDRLLGRVTTVGAAFMAIAADRDLPGTDAWPHDSRVSEPIPTSRES